DLPLAQANAGSVKGGSMRALLVLALIPLLASCSVFSKSEPSATLAEAPPATETAAGTVDSTGTPESGVPAEAASGTPTSLATIPTAAATLPATAAATTPAPAATPAPAPAANAPTAKVPEPEPYTPTSAGSTIAG